MLTAIVCLLAFNAFVFAWLAYGRYVPWSRYRSTFARSFRHR